MTDEITRRLRELGEYGNGVIPARLDTRYTPTRSDAKAFTDDILLLARKADAVLEAYGNKLYSHGVIDARSLKENFVGVFENALLGNATFAIEDGIETLLEDAREAAE